VSASDPDGDGVEYVFALSGTAGGSLDVTLDVPTSAASATYTAPADAIGTDTVSVTARDGRGMTLTAETVNIETVNRAPQIAAFVSTETAVARDGSTGLDVDASDADSDGLTYTFAILSGPGSLGGTNSATGKTFTAGSGFGVTEIQVTVEDNFGDTATSTLTVFTGKTFDLGGDISVGRAVYLNILSNSSGDLHVAYIDNFTTDAFGSPINTDDDAAIVKRWDSAGPSWVQFGSDVAASATFTELAFDGDVPYLAFYDLTNGGVRVQTYGGSSWSALGTVACPGLSSVPFPALAVTSTEVNVACTTSSGGLGLRVHEWTGSTWSSTPNSSGDDIAGAQTWGNQLLVGPAGELVVGFIDLNTVGNATDEDVFVKTRGATTWDTVGSAFTDQDYDWPRLATDGTDLFLALLADTDFAVRVYRYDSSGGDWVQVGPDLPLAGVGFVDSIGIDFAGTDMYVGFRDGSAYRAYLYDSGTNEWITVGGPIAMGSTYPRMTIHDGKVHIVYLSGGKARVSYID
jgi:hypothetical protein